MSPQDLNGAWTYRSYLNDPELVGSDKDKALALIFGEGTITIDVKEPRLFQAILDMGPGYAMDLYGEIVPGTGVSPDALIITGTGREGTDTAKWVYQYKGYVVPQWSEGVGQVPAMVGTVIRTPPHGTGTAGVVASFVMIRA